MNQEADPCSGCTELIIRAQIQPYCRRATHYGQVGCLRKSRVPREWQGLPPQPQRRGKPRRGGADG